MQKDTVKTSVVTLLAAVHYHKEEIVRDTRDTRDALKAVEELPGGEQEAAVKGLCEKLEEAKALVFAWANDHGEP